MSSLKTAIMMEACYHKDLYFVREFQCNSTYYRSDDPTSMRPTLPIIGNLHQLVGKNSLPHHRLAELAAVYGPIMHLRLGQIPTVVVSSADGAREVMRTHDAAFNNRPSILMAEHVFYGRTDIGFAPYGEYWPQVRKIAMLDLFTVKQVQSFGPIREEEVANLVVSLATEQGSVVNLSKKLFALSFDITSSFDVKCNSELEVQVPSPKIWMDIRKCSSLFICIYGRSSINELFKKIHLYTPICFTHTFLWLNVLLSVRLAFKKKGIEALVDDVTKIASGFSICDLYPSIKYLCSITGMRRELQDLVRRCNKIVDPIIYDHISKKRQGKKEDHEDLVDVVLTFHKDQDELSYGSQFSLAIDNIKAILLQVLSAGSETSSTTIE
ncbi:hypothetical protein Cgig2_015593 [Carnegiea gigantea]|uniref:Cytochrome P450 n=1 Tax=Carnegiea gigantea TaxID=171969 RepID=A0A9Q1JXB4_9CARY|nr:hypothetical protein Cgig2_015593 [Carnegiea gigantea]